MLYGKKRTLLVIKRWGRLVTKYNDETSTWGLILSHHTLQMRLGPKKEPKYSTRSLVFDWTQK